MQQLGNVQRLRTIIHQSQQAVISAAYCGMVHIATAAIRGSSRFRRLYQRVSRKHGKNVARVAVAREMLCVIYHMLTKGEEFRDKEQQNRKEQQSQGNQ